MQSVTVTDGSPSTWGRPVPLFEFEERYVFTPFHRVFDVAQDGRFLMIKEPTATEGASISQAQIILIQNWFQELTERVPVP